MLDRIPVEVLHLIVNNIKTQSDLKSLCEVSKYVAKVAQPRLYESITLHADEMMGLDDLIYKIEQCSNDNLRFTKLICLNAPLHYNIRKRCPHYLSEMPEILADVMDMYDDDSDVDVSFLDPFCDLSTALFDLLTGPSKNNLHSLSLNLGSCIPKGVLDFSGRFWIENQKHIQSISLLTDGGCPSQAFVKNLDLGLFTNLQSLSWEGLNRGDHFDSLASFVKNQTQVQRLKSLVLDLVDWTTAQTRWHAHKQATLGGPPPHLANFFATNILGIQQGQDGAHFESLETLKLVGVAFWPFENELSHSFNMTNLTALQLRNCPSSLEMLTALLDQDISLRLKSLELAIDWNCLHHFRDSYDGHDEAVSQILDSFQGLEDLCLLLTQPLEWYLVVNGICNHQSTLKRLVLHEGTISTDEVVLEGGIPWLNSGELLFNESQLTCFGTTGSIPVIETAFKDLPTRPGFKILHIRRPWIELHKEWEEDLLSADSDGDFESNSQLLSEFLNVQKFPSYPRKEDPTEAFDTAEPQSPKRTLPSQYSGLHEFIFQDPKISKRSKKIANRSDFSGPAEKLLEFASWAFSPDGLPGLQILAWGDFSYDGRWGESNVLLCREQSNHSTGTSFRTLRDTDFYYWDLIDENMDMLSACPSDQLFWVNYGIS